MTQNYDVFFRGISWRVLADKVGHWGSVKTDFVLLQAEQGALIVLPVHAFKNILNQSKNKKNELLQKHSVRKNLKKRLFDELNQISEEKENEILRLMNSNLSWRKMAKLTGLTSHQIRLIKLFWVSHYFGDEKFA